MNFYKALQQVDNGIENIVVKVLSGMNVGARLLLSGGELIYTNNDNIDWNRIISYVPSNKKSQIVTKGNEKFFFEPIKQNYKVVICGAGHISISIIKMCKLLDLDVTVIDDRLTFVNNAMNAGADKVICESFEKALDQIEGDNGTFFIIVTRGHRYDEICLEKIIDKDKAYIGMIGSKLRVKKVLDFLEEKGVPRYKLDKVYTPIGLKIGAETPSEIAVSIMAEIIEVKNKSLGSNTYTNELLNDILDENSICMPKALVTIVSRRGSTPREVGTKMVVHKDGTMIGTIGGGCVEAKLRQKAFECIEKEEYQLMKIDMTGNDAEDEGMVCGGIVELFIEPIHV